MCGNFIANHINTTKHDCKGIGCLARVRFVNIKCIFSTLYPRCSVYFMAQTLIAEKYVQLPTFKVILTLQNYIAKLFVRVYRVPYDVLVCIFRLVWSIVELTGAHLAYSMWYCISNVIGVLRTDTILPTTPHSAVVLIMTIVIMLVSFASCIIIYGRMRRVAINAIYKIFVCFAHSIYTAAFSDINVIRIYAINVRLKDCNCSQHIMTIEHEFEHNMTT